MGMSTLSGLQLMNWIMTHAEHQQANWIGSSFLSHRFWLWLILRLCFPLLDEMSPKCGHEIIKIFRRLSQLGQVRPLDFNLDESASSRRQGFLNRWFVCTGSVAILPCPPLCPHVMQFLTANHQRKRANNMPGFVLRKRRRWTRQWSETWYSWLWLCETKMVCERFWAGHRVVSAAHAHARVGGDNAL